MGQSKCTENQMKNYLKKINPQVKESYLKLPKIYLQEGKHEGVRGDIAFAQALHETNFFRFGGDVTPEQNNFAGIGAIGNKAKGATFPSPRQGIRAQIQHLKAYASKMKLKRACVDPRFSLVKRGCAHYVENLSGKWAFPGYDKKKYNSLKAAQKKNDTYGHKIQKYCQEIQREK